ncbi:MAG: P-type conjugative transfer ATPase TrbB [Alphaproteobacteria bacterium]|nr:P-type conjugative transfer ATPase TrbB [Alphaproteobacteria bacterium]
MTLAADAIIDASRGLAMLHTALGPAIAAILHAPDTIEIIVNPDGCVFVERIGESRAAAGFSLGAAEAERAIRLIASLTGSEATRERPIVSAELPPHGERFEGVLPPVARAPCFAIRKPASRVIRLSEYVEDGVITAEQKSLLEVAINARANIIVAGGTGSGKTTLANALLAEIAALDQRIVILEDTRELQCAAADVVALRTQPGSVSLGDLVRSTMRLRPDRIVVGEVRGREALDLLKAWNTGHPGGLATIHANSARSALARLEQLAMEGAASPPTALIAETIDLVVFIERGGRAGRKLSQIYAPSKPIPDCAQSNQSFLPETLS